MCKIKLIVFAGRFVISVEERIPAEKHDFPVPFQRGPINTIVSIARVRFGSFSDETFRKRS
jgi:hypothetical protein